MVRRAYPLTTRTGQERTVDITLSPIAGKVKSRYWWNSTWLIASKRQSRRVVASAGDVKEIMKGVARSKTRSAASRRSAAGR